MQASFLLYPLSLTSFGSSPKGMPDSLSQSLTALPASSLGGAPSQALPRQLSQGESQAVNLDAKVSDAMRKLPAVLLALPLGELSP